MSDLIDRQQAIEAICMETCGVSLRNERCMVHCTEVQTVEKLPPAQPERIKGHWVDDCTYMGIQCSVCGKSLQDYIHATEYAELMEVPNFCPNCGAEMREEKEK